MGFATALQGSGHKGSGVAKVAFGKGVESTSFPELPGTKHEKKSMQVQVLYYLLLISDARTVRCTWAN